MKQTCIPDADRHFGWIDYAKTLSIFFVVLLHTYCVAELTAALNSFVMQAFFFFSGFLFLRERNPDYRRFVDKRFRQLIVPYLWINAVAYAAWLFVLRHFGSDADAEIGWHEPLTAIAIGLPPGLVHDIPLWSLLCFFVVEIVYYPLHSMAKWGDLTIAGVFFCAASALSLLAPEEGIALPLALAPAMSALAFYAFGHWVRAHITFFKAMFRPDVLLLLLGIALFQIGFAFNSPVWFFMGKMGNPVWYLLEAAGGILFTVQTAAWLSRVAGDGGFIRFLSRGTLLICGFHLLAFALIKGVMLFGFGIEPSQLTDGFLPGLLFALAAFALCLPPVWLIGRYMRFLVSK